MPDKKKPADEDEARVESERKSKRGDFEETADPEVSAAPASRAADRSSMRESVDRAPSADEEHIAPQDMAPLDADAVGAPLTGASAEDARTTRSAIDDDMPPPASLEAREPGEADTPSETAPPGNDRQGPRAEPVAAGLAAPADSQPDVAPSDNMARSSGTSFGHSPDRGGHGDGNDSRNEVPDRSHDEAADEGGRSLAGTLLAALLLLIAGAAIGIWAAPRVAPHLPAGMAPVAEWLSPRDTELQSRVAALEDNTEASLAGIRAEVERLATEGDDTSEFDARLAEIEAGLDDRISALGDDLAALDGTETRDRLSRLEAAVEGQQDTLSSLRDQLAQVDVVDAAPQVDAYEAEVAGLRGEFRDVAGQVGALSRRIDEVAADAQRQVEVARQQVEEIEAEAVAGLTRAEIDADLAQIRSALASGSPYDEPVERLATHTEAGVPDALVMPASEGVPTLSSLRQGFPDAASRAIRADVQARADDDFFGRLRGFAEAQVATRSLEPRPGTDTDSVLSRVEAALRQDDLETALDEADALPLGAQNAMADWLEAAQMRRAAVEGFEQVEADLSPMN